MKAIILCVLGVLCVSILTGCQTTGGAFNASYTEPQSGVVFSGGVVIPPNKTASPARTARDNK